jgi:hypothetical protein
MWLFLWVVFVMAAIGYFLWSYHAIYEQKRAWKAFAAKFNLQYFPGQMMESPTMNGMIKGHDVNFYPQIVDTPQGQKVNQNVVEVFLNNRPDLITVVSTPGLSDFVSSLGMPEPFSVQHPDWPQNLLSRTFENEAPESWFLGDEKRIKALQKMSKLPFDWAFMCDLQQSFIAVRTSNPLSEPAKIGKLMGLMFDVLKDLEDFGVPQQQAETQVEDKPQDQAEAETITNPNDDKVTQDPSNDASRE